MGTPDFALSALKALVASVHDVVCVYSQPPRPKGRGQQIQPSPVHLYAQEQGIPVFHPVTFKDSESQAVFSSHHLDVAVVAAYGLLLPVPVLQAPRHGCLNIHASLLPRWRGASPIQRAILAGDVQSGVTIMQMDAGLDTGPEIRKDVVLLGPHTTAQSLHDDLAARGARMIVEVLDTLEAQGHLTGTPQVQGGVTTAPLLKKEEGRIDWKQSAEIIDRQIRALNPWPGVWTMLGGKRLKILSAMRVDGALSGPAGEILDDAGYVRCGTGCLQLQIVQPESAKPMKFSAALHGGYVQKGDVLT